MIKYIAAACFVLLVCPVITMLELLVLGMLMELFGKEDNDVQP